VIVLIQSAILVNLLLSGLFLDDTIVFAAFQIVEIFEELVDWQIVSSGLEDLANLLVILFETALVGAHLFVLDFLVGLLILKIEVAGLLLLLFSCRLVDLCELDDAHRLPMVLLSEHHGDFKVVRDAV